MGHNCWITGYRGISASSTVARLLNPVIYLCSPTGKEVLGIIKKFYAQRYRPFEKPTRVKRIALEQYRLFRKLDDQVARFIFSPFFISRKCSKVLERMVLIGTTNFKMKILK